MLGWGVLAAATVAAVHERVRHLKTACIVCTNTRMLMLSAHDHNNLSGLKSRGLPMKIKIEKSLLKQV